MCLFTPRLCSLAMAQHYSGAVPSIHFDPKRGQMLHISPSTPPILPMKQQVVASCLEARGSCRRTSLYKRLPVLDSPPVIAPMDGAGLHIPLRQEITLGSSWFSTGFLDKGIMGQRGCIWLPLSFIGVGGLHRDYCWSHSGVERSSTVHQDSDSFLALSFLKNSL